MNNIDYFWRTANHHILSTNHFLPILQDSVDTLVQLEGPGLRRRAEVLRDRVDRRLADSSFHDLE